MSYDLLFWCQQPGTTVDSASLFQLEDAVAVPGLIPVLRLDVERAFQTEFNNLTVGDTDLNWEGAG